MTSFNKFKKWLGIKTDEPLDSKSEPSLTLSELLENYTVVDVVPSGEDYGPFVVVTERADKVGNSFGLDFTDPDPVTDFNFGAQFEEFSRQTTTPPVVTRNRGPVEQPTLLAENSKPDYGEIGSSSPSPYTSFLRKEYNRDLEGLEGLKKYNKMRSDGVVSGTLLLFKTPVYAAKWFMEPASQEDSDKEIADFAWKCLTEYMSITWTQIKTEALLFCEFGYYSFEKVWEKRVIDGEKRVVLKKLAPRHPMDVKEWHYDKNGGPKSVDIYVEDPENDGAVEEKNIPIEKLLVFTLNREANDITGRSMLRPIYKHHYYKEQLYKIDAIQKERHGIGVPVIKLPPNFTDADKVAANLLGRNLRTNERAHVVLPPNWEVMFAKLEGQPVDAIKSIELHDKAIRESVLAAFLSSDSATKEEDVSLFLKATRFIADSICDAFNLYLIPELVRYNFGKDAKVPKLRVRRIGEQADWRILAFAIRNLIGAGVIRPDDKLEAAMREEMDLPIADVSTIRIVNTPQAGQGAPATVPNATPGQQSPTPVVPGKTDGSAGSTGLPRATPLPKVGMPGGNAGNDKGGQS